MSNEVNSKLREARQAYDAGDYARAAMLLAPLADAGEPDAQYMLGQMYRWGTGVPPDARESLRWYEAAADAGHAMAAWELAHIYRVGGNTAPSHMEELPKDAEKSKAYYAAAARRFTAAAHQGDAAAMAMLGFLQMWGDGVAQDAHEAERWLTRAIDAGHHGAANNLCLLYYESNDDRVRNVEKARHWYGRLKALNCQCIRIDEFEP